MNNYQVTNSLKALCIAISMSMCLPNSQAFIASSNIMSSHSQTTAYAHIATPIIAAEDSMWFISIAKAFNTKAMHHSLFGLGYRQAVASGVIGLQGHFRLAKYDNYYHQQVNLELAYFMQNMYLRLATHIPVSKPKTKIIYTNGNILVNAEQVMVNTSIHTAKLIPGIELEVGQQYSARITSAIKYYHFLDDNQHKYGVKLYTKLHLKQFLSINTEVNWDKHKGAGYFIGLQGTIGAKQTNTLRQTIPSMQLQDLTTNFSEHIANGQTRSTKTLAATTKEMFTHGIEHVTIQSDATITLMGDYRVKPEHKLYVISEQDIDLINANINVEQAGHLRLQADAKGSGFGRVNFINSSIQVAAGIATNKPTKVEIFYNPTASIGSNKYQHPMSLADITVDGEDFHASKHTIFGFKSKTAISAYMLVNTPWDLIDIKHNIGGSSTASKVFYALGTNIDMRGIEFVPIGMTAESKSFNGAIHGQGYSIANLSISNLATGGRNVGFIAKCMDSFIHDINFVNLKIVAVNTAEVGSRTDAQEDLRVGLFAEASRCQLRNIRIHGQIQAGRHALVGGVVGVLHAHNLIENLSFIGSITADDSSRAGGIVSCMDCNNIAKSIRIKGSILVGIDSQVGAFAANIKQGNELHTASFIGHIQAGHNSHIGGIASEILYSNKISGIESNFTYHSAASSKLYRDGLYKNQRQRTRQQNTFTDILMTYVSVEDSDVLELETAKPKSYYYGTTVFGVQEDIPNTIVNLNNKYFFKERVEEEAYLALAKFNEVCQSGIYTKLPQAVVLNIFNMLHAWHYLEDKQLTATSAYTQNKLHREQQMFLQAVLQ